LLRRLEGLAPKSKRVRFLFEDEARFGLMTDLRACWALLPMRPRVRQTIIRNSTDALLAVHPPSGRFHAFLCRGLDRFVMAEFLRQTKNCFRGDFCVVFCDGAGWHTAGDLKVPNEMHMEILPPYSPELNPVESVWDYMRDHDFGNRIFADLEKVEDQLSLSFRALRAAPQVMRSITLFNWIKAATLTRR
jgi:transposase